jgi:hypothetical protein
LDVVTEEAVDTVVLVAMVGQAVLQEEVEVEEVQQAIELAELAELGKSVSIHGEES